MAAVEIDDPGSQSLQEAAIVGNENQSAVKSEQQVFEPQDRIDIEVVGGFVEQQQIGLCDERLAQQNTAF